MAERLSLLKNRDVLWTNPLTLAGLLFVATGILLLLTFWLFVLASPAAAQNQYLNVVGYMILPGVLVNGLILCPAGMILRRRRLKRGPVHQVSTHNALIFLAVTFFLILPILGVAGYRGYQYTDSPVFCGTVCHNMIPQHTGYERSPHAHVTCAGCHIGAGAAPFVEAKLAGLRQVYQTVTDSYKRPVPCAITELRPARETCEDCHWPSQFFGSKLEKIAHYSPDEHNTRHDYEILVKVGGLNNFLGQAEGIHMHMLDRIEYVAIDHDLNKIPYVRYKYPDGREAVFRSDGKPSADPAPAGKMRKLDCIDCHNLAGHEFRSPERAVNHALSVGQLELSLPFIKREAVRVLAGDYATTPLALAAIAEGLSGFYQNNYPSLWAADPRGMKKMIATVQDIFQAQEFPEYKVNWKTYASHIGHMESPGCFRCHDGLHVTDKGSAISSDCNTCHTFLYRQADDPNKITERKFDHPMKIHDLWQDLGPHNNMLCCDCHDGGLGAIGWKQTAPRPEDRCGSCHSSGRWLQMRHMFRPANNPATLPATQP